MNSRRHKGAGLERGLPVSLAKIGVWLATFTMLVPPIVLNAALGIDPNVKMISRIASLGCILCMVFVLIQRSARIKVVIKNVNLFYWILIFEAFMSLFWSISTDNTLSHLTRFFWEIGVAISITIAGWSRERFQNTFRPAVTFVLLLSLICGLVNPDLAIHQELAPELFHSWRGLTPQKNVFGALAATGSILWIHALLNRSTSYLMSLTGLLISIASLLLSRSTTSLAAVLLSGGLMAAIFIAPNSGQRPVKILIVIVTTSLFAYGLAMLNLIPGLDLLLKPIPYLTGKNLTFSGRSEIWNAVLSHIQLRPYLGSGYGAYWTTFVDSTSESFVVSLIFSGFYPGSAHSGLLDVTNDLGLIGLAVLIACNIRYVSDLLKLYKYDRRQSALFIGLFVHQLFYNMSESGWFNTNSFEFFVFTLTVICTARSIAEINFKNTLLKKSASREIVQNIGHLNRQGQEIQSINGIHSR